MIQLCSVCRRLSISTKTQIRLKTRGQKKTFHANSNQKRAGVATLMSDKTHLNQKSFQETKK